MENEILYNYESNVPKDKDFLIPIGKAKKIKEATMDVSDVASAIINIFKMPLTTNVLNLTILIHFWK